jgi:hypothetical protein
MIVKEEKFYLSFRAILEKNILYDEDPVILTGSGPDANVKVSKEKVEKILQAGTFVHDVLVIHIVPYQPSWLRNIGTKRADYGTVQVQNHPEIALRHGRERSREVRDQVRTRSSF